uniref:Putative secreted protein n=1 Tax=Amblyomma triste TaxID=251400 RepID=A0A023GAE7_AMBTT
MSRGVLASTTAAWLLLLGAAFGSPSCHISSRNTTASVTCSDFGSPLDFEHFIQRPLSRPTLSFMLRDSHLERLPAGAFADVSATSLELSNVTVESYEYAEEDNPFAGLRASVENVTFSGRSSLPASWAIFSDLLSLHALVIFEAPGRLNLTRDFGLLPAGLRHVTVDTAQVGYVDDLWLATLVNLESVTLRNTDVSELKRSMMPRPAAALRNLDLSHNQLTTLPADFGEELPALRELDLSHNRISSLPEASLMPLQTSVTSARLEGNPLECNCGLQFLLRFPDIWRHASCAEPEALRNTSLSEVSEGDLQCAA